MKIIIGVSFRQAGKVYFFDPGDEQIERGVICNTQTLSSDLLLCY